MEAEVESGEALAFLRAGMSPQVLRRLRSGFWAVQHELDLHGLRSDEARELLAEFLNGAQRRGARCVRVIHGKGLRSQNNEPVLKRKVAAWLTQRGDVLAFCEARAAEGGSGAVMVLLKGRGRRDEAAKGSRTKRTASGCQRCPLSRCVLVSVPRLRPLPRRSRRCGCG